VSVSRSLVLSAALAVVSVSLQAQDTAAVVRRGAAVPSGAALPVAQVAARPAAYAGRDMIVEGVITRECTEKGCWMQVAPSSDAAGIRVTFKDYAFFIPQAMVGRRARMHGQTVVKTHSRAAAEHLVHEGAQLARNADGTATEVQFVASGVELFR
jgi:hypothetical protein